MTTLGAQGKNQFFLKQLRMLGSDFEQQKIAKDGTALDALESISLQFSENLSFSHAKMSEMKSSINAEKLSTSRK
jgi:16S rRNA C1402 N4-methylase RsmH